MEINERLQPSRIQAAEMRFFRYVAGYTLHDHRRNTDIYGRNWIVWVYSTGLPSIGWIGGNIFAEWTTAASSNNYGIISRGDEMCIRDSIWAGKYFYERVWREEEGGRRTVVSFVFLLFGWCAQTHGTHTSTQLVAIINRGVKPRGSCVFIASSLEASERRGVCVYCSSLPIIFNKT